MPHTAANLVSMGNRLCGWFYLQPRPICHIAPNFRRDKTCFTAAAMNHNAAEVQRVRWLYLYPQTRECMRHLLPNLPWDMRHTLVRPHIIRLRGRAVNVTDFMVCRLCGGPVPGWQYRARSHVCWRPADPTTRLPDDEPSAPPNHGDGRGSPSPIHPCPFQGYHFLQGEISRKVVQSVK